jgi:hypothetical protein
MFHANGLIVERDGWVVEQAHAPDGHQPPREIPTAVLPERLTARATPSWSLIPQHRDHPFHGSRSPIPRIVITTVARPTGRVVGWCCNCRTAALVVHCGCGPATASGRNCHSSRVRRLAVRDACRHLDVVRDQIHCFAEFNFTAVLYPTVVARDFLFMVERKAINSESDQTQDASGRSPPSAYSACRMSGRT